MNQHSLFALPDPLPFFVCRTGCQEPIAASEATMLNRIALGKVWIRIGGLVRRLCSRGSGVDRLAGLHPSYIERPQLERRNSQSHST